MSTPITPRTWYVRDGDRSVFTATIEDETGTPIPGGSLLTLKCWLYLKSTGATINGRSDQNVLNANGGTVDGSGNFELTLSPADNESQGTGATEIHVLLLRWTYDTDGAGSHEAWIQVTDQPKVSVP